MTNLQRMIKQKQDELAALENLMKEEDDVVIRLSVDDERNDPLPKSAFFFTSSTTYWN